MQNGAADILVLWPENILIITFENRVGKTNRIVNWFRSLNFIYRARLNWLVMYARSMHLSAGQKFISGPISDRCKFRYVSVIYQRCANKCRPPERNTSLYWLPLLAQQRRQERINRYWCSGGIQSARHCLSIFKALLSMGLAVALTVG